MYYAWKVVRHSMLSIAVLVGISEMTDRIAGGWYAVGFIIATVSIGVMLLAVNAAMLSWQEFLDLPEVGLKIPLPKLFLESRFFWRVGGSVNPQIK